jgi:hypothetical protein
LPLFFGVVHGDVKLRMLPLDCQGCLLGCFVCCVSRLQLPIDRNIELFAEGRLAELSRRDCWLLAAIGFVTLLVRLEGLVAFRVAIP